MNVAVNLLVFIYFYFISDLQNRKTTREDAWNTEGWAETVQKTGNLKRV